MNLRHRVFRHKTCVLYFPVLLFLLLCGLSSTDLLAAPSTALAEPPVASLSKAEVSARGRQESILTITKFGRYALTVKSDQGTGLQLIDRMAGPGEIAGTAGEKDGRLDLFLEKGKYKIVTYGHERASGSAHLEVHPFVDKNDPRPPALVDLKLTEAALKDFEQISYWLEIKERRRVTLEASGRSLADLRLWLNGKWLLDAAPAISTAQPKTGQPLRVCRLTIELEPGLYLLSAYGGTPLPWADDSGVSPFYLRAGIPELGSVTRRRFVVSPFGTDRFLVPGSSTYFRIELPEAREASLQVGRFNPADPFNNTGPKQGISKNSVPPVADLLVSGNKDTKHIVTITGEAGAAYIFQHFESNYQYSFRGTGEYWISSVHSGHPQDSIDATAILTSGYDTYRTRPLLDQTIELDRTNAYARRANLLGTLTLFIKINAQGPYQIISQGADCRFVIEPFFTSRPQNYARPGSQPSGYAWELDAGYYVLTVEPVKKGIMDLVIRPVSGKKDPGKDVAPGAVRAAVRFPRVSLDRDTWYTLYMNLQPDVRTGLVLRPLPLDIRDPLPVTQKPGELVSVPIQVAEDGTLRAEAEDGSLMDLSLDNGPWQGTCVVGSGRHTVSIRSTSKDTINYALLIEPRSIDSQTPLPALSDTALASLPDLPVLTDNTPRFFDLERDSSSLFILRADKPDLYRVETTGLLATAGGLRSRTNPAFVQESENGPGRNFSLQQYLREGDYLIAVSSQGESKGHLGLTMMHTGLLQGGLITSRAPARMSLPAGKSAAYHFIIAKRGEYRLRSIGLGKTVKCRLEDEDGWPIAVPNIDADIRRTFEKGQYRLIILPQPTDARIVTVIDPIARARRFEGHGPHSLPLAVPFEHTWLEPKAGQKRRPDQWKFDLPATAEVSIELTGEMQADLLKMNPDKTTSRVAFIPPARGWTGSLQTGTYRIDAVSMRVNNRAPYRVAVRPVPLVDGMSRDISVPSIVPVSVGRDGLVEIASFGSVDVKARLMTDDGAFVAANDDRPDDWNFQIATNLKAGVYRLLVEPVGIEQGTCAVSVRVPKEEERSALVLPANKKIKLSESVRLFHLSLPAKGELLLLSAKAPENVGMAVEVADQGGWKSIGSSSGRNARLEIPLREPGAQQLNGRYRLRLWSLDRRDTVAELNANMVSPPVFSEGDLKKGIVLSTAAAAAIRIERKGLLQTAEEARHLRWSIGPLHPCEEAPDNFLAISGGYVWVAGESGRNQAAGTLARAERVELGSGEGKAIQIRMPDREKVICDLAAPTGGPVVFIASSRIGRPGVELIEQGKDGLVNIDTIAMGEHGSLGLSLNPKKPAARLWAASPSQEPFETRLTQISFNTPERISSRDNAADGLTGSIEGVKAQVYDLPKGQKRVRLSLEEGLAAVLVKNDRIVSTHWAEGNPFTETLESDAERLLLLHTRSAEDRFAIELIPLSSALSTLPLEIGRSYERFMLNSGRLRLSIAPGKATQDSNRTLHVRASGKEPVFIDQAGTVSAGKNILITEQGGTLIVEHGPGAVLSWLDRPGEEAADLWASRDKSDGALITPPASIPLEGKLRAFRINANKPVMLHVRSATPLTTYLDRGDKTPEVEVYSTGVVLDAYLPKGTAELRLRAFSGESMSGRVDITGSAVIPTDEGLGPEILLPPGGARLFSFKVERESTIGAGVKADSDSIDMEILNNSGQVMGKGPAQMLQVKPGIYLMKLQAPDSRVPVRARPALVGLRTPTVGPPADEIRKYLFPDQETPLTYTSRRGAGVSHGSRSRRAALPVYERQEEEAGTEEGTSEGAEPANEPETGESE